jgi:hypothetical protein
MESDKLMLNDDKTEFMIIGTNQQLTKVSIKHLCVGSAKKLNHLVMLGILVPGSTAT